MRVAKFLLTTAPLLFLINALRADITLPSIFSHHMVLKNSAEVPIWGTADPGEKVTITMAGKTFATITDEDGTWKTALDLSETGPGPFEMTLTGKNTLLVTDILVGEVWLASGQSNMEWALKISEGAESEIPGSANPMLREFKVERNASGEPATDVKGHWVVASPETSGTFSGVGYFFGKRLQKELGKPVGVINSSWGGTPVESWTSPEAIRSVPDLQAASERLWKIEKEYPSLRANFITNFEQWLAANKRNDSPVSDSSAFAGLDVNTDGWIPLTIPGPVSTPGLPKTGAIWLRKEVAFPQIPSQISLALPLNGFDSVYWNGTLLASTTYPDHPHPNFIRKGGPFILQQDAIKAGKNVLAIRFFMPVSPAEVTKMPTASTIPLDGQWLAKPEYAFPPLVPAGVASTPKAPLNPPEIRSLPGSLFNGMIAPLVNFAISGVIWYQGEANAGRAHQYRTAFPLMIADWRKQWGSDFPFLFCQLPNFMIKTSEPQESGWAELREAQSLGLSLPHTGQAVLIDIGEAGDIHPRNKRDAGERLASIALAKVYGRQIPYSGPVFTTMEIKDGKVTIHFANTEKGLVAKPLAATHAIKKSTGESGPLAPNNPGSELEGFAICGQDRKWVWADARIDGDSVVVSSSKVPQPVAVRYAWANNPTCNLYNGAGLPASPFRTDDFPLSTLGKKL